MDNTNVKQRDRVWFALVDATQCRLLCCRPTEQGSQQVDEHEMLENTFPEHEHQRPQTGDGMTHDVEEKERRFAGKIVATLRNHIGQHQINHLVIFAPPRMLGLLRKASSEWLNGNVEERQGNLMRLDVGQLADHPMIRELVRSIPEQE
jgi:protein required for attachment to host cells